MTGMPPCPFQVRISSGVAVVGKSKLDEIMAEIRHLEGCIQSTEVNGGKSSQSVAENWLLPVAPRGQIKGWRNSETHFPAL